MSDLSLILSVVLVALAAYRVWVLLALDVVTETPRQWVVGHSPEWVETLIECPWCLGFYLSLMLWAIWNFTHDGTVMTFAFGGLAVSAIVGLLGSRT